MAMLVYIWSRRSPQVRVNFFGLTFQAPFLPWVLMGFSLLLGNSILVDLLGKPASLRPVPSRWSVISQGSWMVPIPWTWTLTSHLPSQYLLYVLAHTGQVSLLMGMAVVGRLVGPSFQ